MPRRLVWLSAAPVATPAVSLVTPALDLAEPHDAQFVMESLDSSGTTRGEPLSVPRSASIASELAGLVIAIGYPGLGSL